MYDRGDAVCVIGAGGTGLAAIKNLREAGFGVDCYERETGVGGGWNWRHDRSPVYASTHLISSKPMTQFPDFPMPDNWPDYPHHSLVLSYLERYADHFGLREHIWFGTEVIGSSRADRGRVGRDHPRLQRRRPGATLRYAGVVVANGHNWSPKLPRYEGLDEYRGKVMHARRTRSRPSCAARRCSSSGAATPAVTSRSRRRSRRRGAGTRPGAATGTPRSTPSAARPTRSTTDARAAAAAAAAPVALQRTLRFTVGDLTRFGLPSPITGCTRATRSSTANSCTTSGHGAITPVPDVERFDQYEVELADGRGDRAGPGDLRDRLPAALRVPRPPSCSASTRPAGPRLTCTRPPQHPTLAVVGLVQPDSGLFTLVALADRGGGPWLRLADAARAGGRGAAARVAAGPGAGRRAGWWTSTRHWFEVDHIGYLRAIE